MTTGHGCMNDLWAFDLAAGAWAAVPSGGDRGAPGSKLTTRQVTASAACCHALGALDDGTLVAFGGLDRRMQPCRALQLAVPLVANAPGGVPQRVPCGLSLRAAPLLLGQAHARCGPLHAPVAVCDFANTQKASAFSLPTALHPKQAQHA